MLSEHIEEIDNAMKTKFKDAQLQAYFDARSWYNGTIEPDKFKEDVLNATEKENVLNFSEWEHYLKDERLVN